MPDAPSCQHADATNLLVLKSEPDVAVELRDKYCGQIESAWHWNKKYWNQVRYDQLSDDFVKQLIEESYRLVVSKLTKRMKNELNL